MNVHLNYPDVVRVIKFKFFCGDFDFDVNLGFDLKLKSLFIFKNCSSKSSKYKSIFPICKWMIIFQVYLFWYQNFRDWFLFFFILFLLWIMSTAFMIIDKSKQLVLILGYIKQYVNEYWINNIIKIIKNYLVNPFYWDYKTLLKQIKLTNNGLIATHQTGSINTPLICDIIFKSGKHSFTIKALEFTSNFNIIIGVVPSKYIPKSGSYIGDVDGGWGYCLVGTKHNSDNQLWVGNYTKTVVKKNDIIKCEIDYNNKTIQFYINGISQGIAFNDLNGYVKPAVSFYGNNDSVQLINVQ